MTKFELYKQENYLPYLKEIKYYKSSKAQSALAHILPTEVIAVLNLIIRDFETKMATGNDPLLYDGISFSTIYVKEQTGLSYSKQQRALDLLVEFDMVKIVPLYQRGVSFKPYNIWNIVGLIKKYIKLTSKPNYNLLDLANLYNNHINHMNEDEDDAPCEDEDEL